MPRFYFNIDDHVYEADEEGQELADAGEAREQAIIFAGALMRDEPNLVWDGCLLKVRVTDEQGRPVTTVQVGATDAEPLG